MKTIGLIGGECTSKTTLAQLIADRNGGIHVTEYLRQFFDANRRPPQQEEQAGIMLQQMRAEESASQQLVIPKILVCDPAALMTAIYSIAYFDDHALMDEAVHHSLGYELILWCGTDIPWEPDGDQRDGVDFREAVDHIIADLVVATLAPAGVQVHRIDGTRAQRVAQIKALNL